MTDITNTVLDERNVAVEVGEAVAISTEGVTVDYSNRSCGKILLIIANTGEGEKKATIEKGDSLQGTEDLEVTVTNSKSVALVIESGKFENVSGDNKGKVVIKGEDEASLTLQVVELP